MKPLTCPWFGLNKPISFKWTWNSFSEKTTVNNILSDEAEAWLKQDEVEFIKKYRTLETNEGSTTEWRVCATNQLDYRQHCEPPLLSVDISSPMFHGQINVCVCERFMLLLHGCWFKCVLMSCRKLLIAYTSIVQVWLTSLLSCHVCPWQVPDC